VVWGAVQVVSAHGKVIVLGADGQLGRQIVAGLGAIGGWQVQGWDLPQVDVTDGTVLQRLIKDARPHWLVNCAAMTHVDGCQERPDDANAVNAEAVKCMADVCNDVGAALLQIGTDYVFDGRSGRPYREDDAANPLGAYARSKWLGEQHARSCDKHLIVRTAWLYGPGGKNFVNTILARAEAGGPLRVVTDEVGSPSCALDVAQGLIRLMQIDARGTYHLVNTGEASWYELARRALDLAGLKTDIQAITAAEYASPTPRPQYSVLDCARYVEVTGHRPRSWPLALEEYIRGVM